MSNLEPTLEQRRIMYQARRGLKELDFYIDAYVKSEYLNADASEQATFAKLLTYEDPDLLNYFLNQDKPEDEQVMALVNKIKAWRHAN